MIAQKMITAVSDCARVMAVAPTPYAIRPIT